MGSTGTRNARCRQLGRDERVRRGIVGCGAQAVVDRQERTPSEGDDEGLLFTWGTVFGSIRAAPGRYTKTCFANC